MKKRDIDLYLKDYPEVWKWLNQCIICLDIGYKPELPETIFPGTALAYHLREMFHCLPVNELGICEQCEKHVKK